MTVARWHALVVSEDDLHEVVAFFGDVVPETPPVVASDIGPEGLVKMKAFARGWSAGANAVLRGRYR